MSDQNWHEFKDQKRRGEIYWRKRFEYRGQPFFVMITLDPGSHRLVFVREDGTTMDFCHVKACMNSYSKISAAKRVATLIAKGAFDDFSSRLSMDLKGRG